MKTIPLNLLLLCCVVGSLGVFAKPTNFNPVSYGIEVKTVEAGLRAPTSAIPVCEGNPLNITNGKFPFVGFNSKIQLKRYFLGYNFDSQLSHYKGRVGIYFGVFGDSVNKLVLHSTQNNITSLSIQQIQNNVSSAQVNVDNEPLLEARPIFIQSLCVSGDKKDLLVVGFNRNLSPDGEYKLDIEFDGAPSDGMNGIYKSHYQVPQNNSSQTSPPLTEKIISTHFEPHYARQAFPCFDEPSMKARFSIYLTHPKTYKSFSNMGIKSKLDNGDNTVTVFFEETPPMSTYLVAFSINNYSVVSKISDSINGINVSVLLPSHMINTGEFALDVATKALKLFESLTLIPYALNKLDLIGIPSFEAGAMENWGLITFRLTQMIFDNATVTTKGKEFTAMTVIHEVSHQWFGNYVTMKSWYDIWLNEGFATFMEMYATDRLFPQWNVKDEERALHIDSAIGFDELDLTHAMSVPENYTENVETLFDQISYQKSGNVLAMLHEVIGDDTFWTVIKKYLNTFAFSSASSTDLWSILSEEIKTPDITEMINSWIFNPGLPVVRVAMVNRTGNQSEISLSQQRFIMSPSMEQINFKNPEKWTIPVMYQIQYDTNETIYDGVWWLSEFSQTIKLDDKVKMIKINKERIGFYVSQYDTNFWNEIINRMETKKNEMSASDKASLLSDSMRLSKNGMIGFDVPMKLLRILISDLNYYIQMKCLGYLESIGWHVNRNERVYASFKQFMRAYLHQRYQQLKQPNSNLNFTDRHKKIYFNTVSSMCAEYNCSGVVSDLLGMYKEWNSTENKIDPGLFAAVLKSVALHGTPQEIQSLEDHYSSIDEPHLKRRFLYALAQVRNETLLEKYLNASIFQNYVPLQELGSFFSIIASNKCGLNLTWNFIKSNWQQIEKKFVDSRVTLSSLIPGVVSNFKNITVIEEVEDFYHKHSNSIFHKDYKVSVENIEMNADWSARILQHMSSDDIFSI